VTTSGGGPAFFAIGEPARRIKTRSGADGPLEKARQDGIAHLIEKWRSIDSYLSTKLFFSISIAPPSTTQLVFVSSAARSNRHCSPHQCSASAELRQYKWAQGVDSVVSAPDCKTQPHSRAIHVRAEEPGRPWAANRRQAVSERLSSQHQKATLPLSSRFPGLSTASARRVPQAVVVPPVAWPVLHVVVPQGRARRGDAGLPQLVLRHRPGGGGRRGLARQPG